VPLKSISPEPEIFSGVHVDQQRYIFFGLALTTVILIVNAFSIRARLVRDRKDRIRSLSAKECGADRKIR
jgi:hypothetical protein